MTQPRRLRILHVVLNLEMGGLERLIADVVRRLNPSEFESHVMGLDFLGRYAEGLEDVTTLHTARPLPRWSMLWPGPLIHQIAGIAPDVVHTHSGVWYKASLASRRAGVPYLVHTDHGRKCPDPWLDRFIDSRAARRTNVVVAVSRKLAEQLERSVVSNPASIQVIRNGVDTDLYRPQAEDLDLRSALGIPIDAPIVGGVGRFDAIKGYDVLIRAFAEVCAARSWEAAPVLVLAGDGPERIPLRELVGTLSLDGRVKFVGWHNDVPHLFSIISVFAMASHSEGTSVSLLEAMSTETCPVVTDVGGNADVLGPSLAHRLVEPDNPTLFAQALLEALTQPNIRAADAVASRERVCADFGLAKMVRAYEEIYSSLHHHKASAA